MPLRMSGGKKSGSRRCGAPRKYGVGWLKVFQLYRNDLPGFPRKMVAKGKTYGKKNDRDLAAVSPHHSFPAAPEWTALVYEHSYSLKFSDITSGNTHVIYVSLWAGGKVCWKAGVTEHCMRRAIIAIFQGFSPFLPNGASVPNGSQRGTPTPRIPVAHFGILLQILSHLPRHHRTFVNPGD